MPYLPLAALPTTLWKDEKYHVARHLQAAYEQQLTARNLMELAKSSTNKRDVYGGESLEATNEHFALRFSASVVRVQNVLLDTQSKFDRISCDLLDTFSSHRISMLDIPCGTGAGGLTIISVIHELRLAGILPTLPLHITIIAADISLHAMEIYRGQLAQLQTDLKSTGIEVDLTTQTWDAMDLVSTNELCVNWEQTVGKVDEAIVLVTNFSGAGKTMFDAFKESWRHISVRASHRQATLLWIEPGDSSGKDFLERLSKAIRSLFGIKNEEKYEPPCSEAKWYHALNRGVHVIRSSVLHYARPQ